MTSGPVSVSSFHFILFWGFTDDVRSSYRKYLICSDTKARLSQRKSTSALTRYHRLFVLSQETVSWVPCTSNSIVKPIITSRDTSTACFNFSQNLFISSFGSCAWNLGLRWLFREKSGLPRIQTCQLSWIWGESQIFENLQCHTRNFINITSL